MSNKLDYGVQSWCFRHYKNNADVAKLVRDIGLTKTELCAVYADFHKPDEFQAVVDTYRAAGVSICSLGVETLEGNPNERDIFKCAALAGAKHISVHFKVGSYPQAIAQAKQLSDEYGVKVGIHCHGGYMFGGQPDVLEHLITLGAPQIGLCIDTAWCMQIGPWHGKPVEWAKRYAGKITGVHFKDFVFNKDGGWNDVIVGQGNLDLPAFVAALQEGGFDGMSVIEYEGDVENPLPALKGCVEAMRRQIG